MYISCLFHIFDIYFFILLFIIFIIIYIFIYVYFFIYIFTLYKLIFAFYYHSIIHPSPRQVPLFAQGRCTRVCLNCGAGPWPARVLFLSGWVRRWWFAFGKSLAARQGSARRQPRIDAYASALSRLWGDVAHSRARSIIRLPYVSCLDGVTSGCALRRGLFAGNGQSIQAPPFLIDPAFSSVPWTLQCAGVKSVGWPSLAVQHGTGFGAGRPSFQHYGGWLIRGQYSRAQCG